MQKMAVAWTAVAGTLALGATAGCTPAAQTGARAKVITQKSELIGGPHALADIGDTLIENADARFILQQTGFSRGFGVFGGGLIDADIARPTASTGSENAPHGRDNFAEMFPAFFLVAMEPREIYFNRERRPAMEILPPGKDGSASVIVRGRANQFLALTEFINNTVVGPEYLLFETIYRLPPTGRTLEITTRVLNDGPDAIAFQNRSFTGSIKLDIPFGDVVLFGAGNQVFAPGDGGFDLRYQLARRYTENTQLPALPGLVVDYLASRGKDVSYGFFVQAKPPGGANESNFVMAHAGAYGDRAAPGKIQVPFVASAFTGVYHTQGPAFLQPGDAYEFTRYFSVGNGDVASIADEVYRVRGQQHGALAGRVTDGATSQALEGLSVIAIDSAGQPYCQATTRAGGNFTMPLPAGHYRVLVAGPGRDPSVPIETDVHTGRTTGINLVAVPTARLAVTISDGAGSSVPGKVTVVGSYGQEQSGLDPKDHLFNLAIGEAWRNTDFVADVASDEATRRYIEQVLYTADGSVDARLRPGTYDVVVSRGPEYDTDTQRVIIPPGGSAQVASTVHRVVDTTGYVSADFHIHSVGSIDSSILPEPRVTTYAAEGLEVMVSTDHNFVVDFMPVIQKLGLNPWMRSFVGLELTTLEMGHFNSYPLRYDPAQATHGSFEWSSKTPDEIFNALRDLGALGRDRTIVQVNHPRDTILGFFNNFTWDQETGIASGQTDPVLGINVANYPNFAKENFSLDFDAIEVLNGKRFEYFHTYVVPDPLPPPPLPANIPATGQPVRDDTGRIAFPGVIEDWFKLLRMGYKHAGVANSDSHGLLQEEAGYPRTYIRARSDDPAQLQTDELVDAVRSMDMVMTNGPFISLTVNGATMGATATADGGNVNVRGEVRMAPWIHPGELVIFEGGTAVRTLPIPHDATVFSFDETLTVARDTFVMVEVHDGDSMFPVVTTFDEAPLLINDALTAIGGSLGLGGNPYGNLSPTVTRPITPFALTNPVFVDADGNGTWTPLEAAIPRLPYRPQGNVDIPAASVGQVAGPPRLWDIINEPVRGQALDVRRIFKALNHHHGG